jgi:hypothetical protein
MFQICSFIAIAAPNNPSKQTNATVLQCGTARSAKQSPEKSQKSSIEFPNMLNESLASQGSVGLRVLHFGDGFCG